MYCELSHCWIQCPTQFKEERIWFGSWWSGCRPSWLAQRKKYHRVSMAEETCSRVAGKQRRKTVSRKHGWGTTYSIQGYTSMNDPDPRTNVLYRSRRHSLSQSSSLKLELTVIGGKLSYKPNGFNVFIKCFTTHIWYWSAFLSLRQKVWPCLLNKTQGNANQNDNVMSSHHNYNHY